MDAFERELMRRSPLAACVLELSDYVLDERLLASVWGGHRGRCYEDVLRFEDFLRLMRDALVRHGGSAHALFVELERDGAEPVDGSNFYRKLARTPPGLGRALLRECSARLAGLMPEGAGVALPGCFGGFEVVAGDGKKIKNAAKRLKPTRGFSGKLLGAKALVAMPLRSGLAVAMSDSLDGEANDVPLVPELLPQVRAVVPGPILWLADRQFGDLHVPRLLTGREGDRFLLRLRKGLTFTPDPAAPARVTRDEHGREVLDELGVLGKGKDALRVRRVTLRRADAAGGDDDVVLVTDLLDRREFDAEDLLKLYRRRWGVEQMFQQVTETFSLSHLTGCTPRAVLFQFAFCLLMYNLVQVVKAYVARDGGVERGSVSTANLFYDVKRELLTWSYFALPAPPAAADVRSRLRELLEGSWDPLAYPKAADKNPRPRRNLPTPRLHGGHTSVQRLLDGTAKVTPQ